VLIFFGTSVGLYHSYTKSELSRIFNERLRFDYDGCIRGGFRGYDKTYIIIINDQNELNYIKNEVDKFYNSLKDSTLYSFLPVGVFRNASGSVVYKSLFKESVKISKNLGPSNLAYSLHLAIDYIMSIYDLKSVDQVILYYKVWVTREDLKVAYDEAVKTLDHVFERRLAENRIVNQVGGSVVEPSLVPTEKD